MDKRHPTRTAPPDLHSDNRRDYPPDLRVVIALSSSDLVLASADGSHHLLQQADLVAGCFGA